ncbi:MAG: hypothetical protein L0K84_07560, partial [Acidipropionibacterium jensenii]|nr:hypothetical protein [Acidipropionibacterium jensenii]
MSHSFPARAPAVSPAARSWGGLPDTAGAVRAQRPQYPTRLPFGRAGGYTPEGVMVRLVAHYRVVGTSQHGRTPEQGPD